MKLFPLFFNTLNGIVFVFKDAPFLDIMERTVPFHVQMTTVDIVTLRRGRVGDVNLDTKVISVS
jgi:hypothetical protein